jgi:hypothetical protein
VVCWLLEAFAGRALQPHPQDRLVVIGWKTQAVNESEPGVITVRLMVPFSAYSLHAIVLDQVTPRNALVDELHSVEATADQATAGVDLKIPALVRANYVFEVSVRIRD